MGSMSKGIAVGAVGALVVAAIAWLTVVYTGAYNVAATEPHTDAVRWTFDTTMHRSIENRAQQVALPEQFSDALIAEGARHYDGSCIHCHGAPGQEPAEWSRGMRPEPPLLVEGAAEWSSEEIHWIVENGIKMTGMPAFGPHHEPEEIEAITAFVTQLPGLSRQEYAALTGRAGGEGRAQAPAHQHRH